MSVGSIGNSVDSVRNMYSGNGKRNKRSAMFHASSGPLTRNLQTDLKELLWTRFRSSACTIHASFIPQCGLIDPQGQANSISRRFKVRACKVNSPTWMTG